MWTKIFFRASDGRAQRYESSTGKRSSGLSIGSTAQRAGCKRLWREDSRTMSVNSSVMIPTKDYPSRFAIDGGAREPTKPIGIRPFRGTAGKLGKLIGPWRLTAPRGRGGHEPHKSAVGNPVADHDIQCLPGAGCIPSRGRVNEQFAAFDRLSGFRISPLYDQTRKARAIRPLFRKLFSRSLSAARSPCRRGVLRTRPGRIYLDSRIPVH